MFSRASSPKPRILTLVAVTLAMPLGVVAIATPAAAQISVFDPTNYTQNLLTAARSLQQINNQIRSLQNQATMLTNMAKNLSRVDFPELQQLNQTLQQIDRLMGQARGIGFRADGIDGQFDRLFPQTSDQATTASAHAADAEARLETAMAAFRETIGVQAQVVDNVRSDARTLSAIVARSQGAEGSLQAQQAANQLLALSAKQQLQIQNLMAAQYRADAIEQARRAQSEADARSAAAKFLGSGTAYTPR